jgi:hypothetical protein
MQAQAAAVAAHVPGATMQQTNTVGQVTLLLGHDGHTVTSDSQPPTPAGTSATAPPGITTAQQAATGCIN